MNMMLRKGDERGRADFGWLDSRHTFSFGEYYDPRNMGFGTLRVINDDRLAGGGGFPTHPHAEMEIITYVLDGALEHKDSMGNESVIRRGDVQRMSAGTGVRHSEYNASKIDPVHFLQIWILPERKGVAPSYEQKIFPDAEKRGALRLVASKDGRQGSVIIHRDVNLYATLLGAGDCVSHKLAEGRGVWIHVARGEVEINGAALKAGDGLAMAEAGEIVLTGKGDTETLLFDMAR